MYNITSMLSVALRALTTGCAIGTILSVVRHTALSITTRGLSTCKVLDDITSDDRLFQVFAAATGKARLPIIQSRVDGTASAEVEDERSRCQLRI